MHKPNMAIKQSIQFLNKRKWALHSVHCAHTKIMKSVLPTPQWNAKKIYKKKNTSQNNHLHCVQNSMSSQQQYNFIKQKAQKMQFHKIKSINLSAVERLKADPLLSNTFITQAFKISYFIN